MDEKIRNSTEVYIKNPTTVSICSHLIENENSHTLQNSDLNKFIEQIKSKFNAQEIGADLKFLLNDFEVYVKFYIDESRKSGFFLLAVSNLNKNYTDKWFEEKLREEEIIKELLTLLPSHFSPMFRTDIFTCDNFGTLEDARKFLVACAIREGVTINAGKICGNHLLARVNKLLDSPHRKFFLIPCGENDKLADIATVDILFDIGFLSIHMGKMMRWHNYYEQEGWKKITAVASDINKITEKINCETKKAIKEKSLMGKALAPSELESLENGLKILIDNFHHTNLILESTSHDETNYRRNMVSAEGIFHKWSEEAVENFSKVTPYEKHFMTTGILGIKTRKEDLFAVKSRANDTLQSLNSYIGLERQKIEGVQQKSLQWITIILACFGIAGVLSTLPDFYLSLTSGTNIFGSLWYGLAFYLSVLFIPVVIVVLSFYCYFKLKKIW